MNLVTDHRSEDFNFCQRSYRQLGQRFFSALFMLTQVRIEFRPVPDLIGQWWVVAIRCKHQASAPPTLHPALLNHSLLLQERHLSIPVIKIRVHLAPAKPTSRIALGRLGRDALAIRGGSISVHQTQKLQYQPSIPHHFKRCDVAQ